MPPTIDTLCYLGDISVGATVYPIGSGLDPATNYGLKLNIGGPYVAGGKPDAGGYWIPYIYTSAIAGTDQATIWNTDATPDLQVAGPWAINWLGPNPGPPVTPAIPFPSYCPAPEVTLIQGDVWNRLDWYPSIVCDAGRNDGMVYDVLRAPFGGPFSVLISGLTELTYTDSALTSGVNYEYRVRSRTTYLSGRLSFEATSPTVATLGLLESWGALAE